MLTFRFSKRLLIVFSVMILSGFFAGCSSSGSGGGDGKTLTSIQVTPASYSLPKGTKLQFNATATYSDKSTQNITSQVVWSSSNPAKATMESTGAATGIVAGSTTITATVGNVSGTSALTVEAASMLVSIAITPAAKELTKGQQISFTAIGTYSDSDPHDLTAQVEWTSSDPTKATVVSTSGLATAVAAGATTITATATNLGGIKGTATLTVDASTLTSIAVKPATKEIAIGQKTPFMATGMFSDGDVHDLTTQVSWTSSDSAKASVVSTSGLATAVAAGATTITATASSLGGVKGTATLTVSTPTDSNFPTYSDNVFSIQYRNSTAETITIWMDGTQPPCSFTEANNCDAGTVNANFNTTWLAMNTSGAFTRSGTHFYITRTTGKSDEIPVANNVPLAKGETLRIVPPIVSGYPQWYYKRFGEVGTAGVAMWVTKAGIDMPAIGNISKFEPNLDFTQKKVWGDMGAVDGINTNATMAFEGPGCSDKQCSCDQPMPAVCMTNIDAFDGSNDGCPYIQQGSSSELTCPNPKFYTTIDANTKKPAWVVPRAQFTTNDASATAYQTIWNAAVVANGNATFTGADLASAASGNSDIKKAYHIWWATNQVGQAWLNYLQKNASGSCRAYGWAYDEKKWKSGDTFDGNGNPPENPIGANWSCPMKTNTYLNTDILKVM